MLRVEYDASGNMTERTGRSREPHGRVKNLYVIRLDDEVLQRRKFLKANPDYQPGKPCMYVGVTSHDPVVRFKQHKEGYKASRFARDYGRYLMWKKFEHLNPIPAGDARVRERALAVELRRKGYGVWQN